MLAAPGATTGPGFAGLAKPSVNGSWFEYSEHGAHCAEAVEVHAMVAKDVAASVREAASSLFP
jgi:hypothetical protein